MNDTAMARAVAAAAEAARRTAQVAARPTAQAGNHSEAEPKRPTP